MGVVADLASPVATLVTDVIDRVFPDKDAQAAQRSELLLKAQEIDAQLLQGQLAIDQTEAANNNIFVSGWRPFIGWACGVIFVYHFMLVPMIYFYCAARHITIDNLPAFDIGTIKDTLEGLLGIYGTQRTMEKMAAAGHLPWQK